MRLVFSLIFSALLITGCAHRTAPGPVKFSADRTIIATCFAGFVVQGNVLAADGTPADYVEVYFIDLGLDHVRAEQAREYRIGTSDENGTLDQGFDYGWCTEASFKSLGLEVPDFSGETEEEPHILFSHALWEAWENAKIPQVFAIEIRTEGFKPHRVEFDLTQLPQPEGSHKLELGTIKLEATPRD
jgi:hypothetical protein